MLRFPAVCRVQLLSCATAFAVSACSGGGNTVAAPVPGVAPAAHSLANSVRRAVSEPACSNGSTAGNVVGGGADNAATGGYSTASGGFENNVCAEFGVVAGGSQNGMDAGSDYSGIEGGQSNAITGAEYATVAGGNANVVTGGYYGFIGGGQSNTETALFSFVGGGVQNAVGAEYGAIAGGGVNGVTKEYGTISGGYNNKASGEFGSIGGGESNIASGEFSTVPGGQLNDAHGKGSFAAGMGSYANYDGDFVWSDVASGATPIAATGDNEFLARARGGVVFYSSANLASGVSLAAGSGTWSSLSDRNAKTGIAPVSDEAILDRVAALPISEWSYATERGVRHVGPMAQDFYAAFDVGEDDRHITSIDEDGVALAAIKALDARLVQRDREIRALRAELRERDASLERQFAALASQVREINQAQR